MIAFAPFTSQRRGDLLSALIPLPASWFCWNYVEVLLLDGSLALPCVPFFYKSFTVRNHFIRDYLNWTIFISFLATILLTYHMFPCPHSNFFWWSTSSSYFQRIGQKLMYFPSPGMSENVFLLPSRINTNFADREFDQRCSVFFLQTAWASLKLPRSCMFSCPDGGHSYDCPL